jgi:hypothetical protein
MRWIMRWKNVPPGKANTGSSKAAASYPDFLWAKFFRPSAGWPRSWFRQSAMSPANSPRAAVPLLIPIGDDDGAAAAGVTGRADIPTGPDPA